MTDLDWCRALDRRADGMTRLAYADWLDEQGMTCHALAQRLLAGRHVLRGTRWVLLVDDLPQQVRALFRLYCDPQDKNRDAATEYVSPLRCIFEMVMLDIVYTMLKNGVDVSRWCAPSPSGTSAGESASAGPPPGGGPATT